MLNLRSRTNTGLKITAYFKNHVFSILNNTRKIGSNNKHFGYNLMPNVTLGKRERFTTIAHAAAFLDYWCDSLEEAKLNADSLIRSLHAHADGIVSFVATRLTNALLEGINSKIQFIKRAARGYRVTKNFKRMILFVFGVLKPTIYAFPTKII